MLELSNLCHCVQHPWKLTSRDFWSSGNKRKPLSKLKCVLRKCCGVSRKWWMLELSNLCHCVQHFPEKLLVWISGALGTKETHFLAKMCFEKMLWGISETLNVRAFKPLPLYSGKVGSSAKFCVVVCKSSLLLYWGVIGQRRFICQVWCSGMPVIFAVILVGHWPKKVQSAMFAVAVFKASILDYPTY